MEGRGLYRSFGRGSSGRYARARARERESLSGYGVGVAGSTTVVPPGRTVDAFSRIMILFTIFMKQ